MATLASSELSAEALRLDCARQVGEWFAVHFSILDDTSTALAQVKVHWGVEALKQAGAVHNRVTRGALTRGIRVSNG